MLTPVLIALGGNLAFSGRDPAENLSLAVARLRDLGLPHLRMGRVYRTPAFPAGSGPDYANACARADVAGPVDAARILTLLHRVEGEFGRERAVRWGGRTLDLDLLAVGDQVWPDPATWASWHDLPPADQMTRAPDRLILPHPRLQDRGFVLVPLCDVAPEWVHPILSQTVQGLRDALPSAMVEDIALWGW